MSNKSTIIKWIENINVQSVTHPITSGVTLALFWIPLIIVSIVLLICIAPLVKLLSYLGYETSKRKVFRAIDRLDRACIRSEINLWNMQAAQWRSGRPGFDKNGDLIQK